MVIFLKLNPHRKKVTNILQINSRPTLQLGDFVRTVLTLNFLNFLNLQIYKFTKRICVEAGLLF